MDKDSKEALQVTKELVAKFIETRNISPGNFAEVFPAIYRVVFATISPSACTSEEDATEKHLLTPPDKKMNSQKR